MYTRSDLRESYTRVGLQSGAIIYVTGNLGRLGFPIDANGEYVRDKVEIAMMHIQVMEEIIGVEGTIIFPTHSWSHIGSEEIFDPLTCSCDYFLSKCLLRNRHAYRQVHPFSSVAAIGARAAEIVSRSLSPHVYGLDSPMAKAVDRNALHVSVGLPAAQTISAVHHCEQVAQVPYRYIKAFRKEIRVNEKVSTEEVYLNVLYRAPGLILERDRNSKIMALHGISSSIRQTSVGRSILESVPLSVFAAETIEAMRNDPYIWLRSIKGERPWMK